MATLPLTDGTKVLNTLPKQWYGKKIWYLTCNDWCILAVLSFQQTLTGFKWMGNRSHDLMKNGHEVLFAFEEAIGFMFGTTVLDKDGISAAAIMAEFAGWLYSQGKSFHSQLEEVYSKWVQNHYRWLTSTVLFIKSYHISLIGPHGHYLFSLFKYSVHLLGSPLISYLPSDIASIQFHEIQLWPLRKDRMYNLYTVSEVRSVNSSDKWTT